MPERTREIGSRRALGVAHRHIVVQFMVETAALSGLGSILGVAAGPAIPARVTVSSEALSVVRPEHLRLAFFVSARIGPSFGIDPAWRAAMTDPVDAPRHE